MYSVLYKKNKHTKFHGNRYNGFRDTAITNSRPPAKFVRGAPVLQLAPGRRVDTQAKPPEFSGGPRRETKKLRGPPE